MIASYSPSDIKRTPGFTFHRNLWWWEYRAGECSSCSPTNSTVHRRHLHFPPVSYEHMPFGHQWQHKYKHERHLVLSKCGKTYSVTEPVDTWFVSATHHDYPRGLPLPALHERGQVCFKITCMTYTQSKEKWTHYVKELKGKGKVVPVL